jgi:hypothetical protein
MAPDAYALEEDGPVGFAKAFEAASANLRPTVSRYCPGSDDAGSRGVSPLGKGTLLTGVGEGSEARLNVFCSRARALRVCVGVLAVASLSSAAANDAGRIGEGEGGWDLLRNAGARIVIV